MKPKVTFPHLRECTVDVIRDLLPQPIICGWYHGYFSDANAGDVVERIRDCSPDLLIVSRGSSLQNDFILRYRNDFGAGVIWNAGGLFNFVSFAVPRAPKWVRVLRTEWLFRLLIEPRRMWRRYFVVGAWFFAQVIRQRFSDGKYRKLPNEQDKRP